MVSTLMDVNLISFATPEPLSIVQLEINEKFNYFSEYRQDLLTRDRLHSKKVVLSARHASGTLPSVLFKHSLGNFFSCKEY